MPFSRDRGRFVMIAALLGLSGCTHQVMTTLPMNERRPADAVEEKSPVARDYHDGMLSKPPAKGGEVVALKSYEVKEAAFSDFGMSVRSNAEVQWGEKIEWMLVHAVAAGSSAEKAGLMPGDRILAMDGQLIVDMDRDRMLELFFQRRPGERARLLILGRQQAMPRFVTLRANRPAKTPSAVGR